MLCLVSLCSLFATLHLYNMQFNTEFWSVRMCSSVQDYVWMERIKVFRTTESSLWLKCWSVARVRSSLIEPQPQITEIESPGLLRYPVLQFPGFKKRRPSAAVNVTASRLSWGKRPLCRLDDTLQLYCTTHQPCGLGSMGKWSPGGWCQNQYINVWPISYWS